MSWSELTGTIVPLVTPFTAEDAFNPSGMRRLITYVLDQGADGIMTTALTGEGPLLTEEETLIVWDVVFDTLSDQLPIVPAIISTTTQRAIRLVQQAETAGAAAVMVAPIVPELYAGRSHDDVYAFYGEIANVTSLPIILFNYPSLTGVDFIPELVQRLTEIENIRYIKESTGDTKRVHGLHRLVGSRISVICGAPNVALESLSLGCRAWITGTMNVVPRSAQQLMRVVHSGDLEIARRIYYTHILPIVDVMARNYNPTGTIKAGIRARGVDVGIPRRPGNDVSATDRKYLAELITTITHGEQEIEAMLSNS